MSPFKVISTGSKEGNCVIYHNSIMLDCGVPYSRVKSVEKDVQIILLTHVHSDHINIKTLKKLQYNRPTLRIGCCEWMMPLLDGLNNIDIYEIGKIYNYGSFKLSPIKLYHDVENCGYRIFKEDYKAIHATDTQHLDGITAKDYDLYSIEHNYDEDMALEAIRISERTGDFCHAKGSINSHLSHQQAFEFIIKNRKESSEVVKLHQSSTYS